MSSVGFQVAVCFRIFVRLCSGSGVSPCLVSLLSILWKTSPVLWRLCEQNEQSVHTNTVSAFIINVCMETQQCCTFVTVRFWVVADLIVKLAKDKFGALQTEYQKVNAGVFKMIPVCVFFALLHFAFLVFFVCSHYHFDTWRELQIFTLFRRLTAFKGGFHVMCGYACQFQMISLLLFYCFAFPLTPCCLCLLHVFWSPSAREHSAEPSGKFCTMYLQL